MRVVNVFQPALIYVCELAFIEHVAVALAGFFVVNFGLVTHRYERLVLLLQVEHVLVVVKQFRRL